MIQQRSWKLPPKTVRDWVFPGGIRITNNFHSGSLKTVLPRLRSAEKTGIANIRLAQDVLCMTELFCLELLGRSSRSFLFRPACPAEQNGLTRAKPEQCRAKSPRFLIFTRGSWDCCEIRFSVLHTAYWRRSCRYFRASPNFGSLWAWIPC